MPTKASSPSCFGPAPASTRRSTRVSAGVVGSDVAVSAAAEVARPTDTAAAAQSAPPGVAAASAARRRKPKSESNATDAADPAAAPETDAVQPAADAASTSNSTTGVTAATTSRRSVGRALTDAAAVGVNSHQAETRGTAPATVAHVPAAECDTASRNCADTALATAAEPVQAQDAAASTNAADAESVQPPAAEPASEPPAAEPASGMNASGVTPRRTSSRRMPSSSGAQPAAISSAALPCAPSPASSALACADSSSDSAPQPGRGRGRPKSATSASAPAPSPAPAPALDRHTSATSVASDHASDAEVSDFAPRAVAAADVAAEGEAQADAVAADAVAADGEAEDGSGAPEGNGKSSESQPVLNADTVSTFTILQLLDFWGPDAVMGQKSHDGTLEDAAEADLKVGEKVLLIAPEEHPYGESMLCYRHVCTVLLVASEDDLVHRDQVKLRYVKWPLPKYDIWMHKRHWHMERATSERLQEHREFNKQYERVKKWAAAERKRLQSKRERPAPSSAQEDADSSSDSEPSGAKPQGKASQPPKRSSSAKPDKTASAVKMSSEGATIRVVSASKAKRAAPAKADSSSDDDTPILQKVAVPTPKPQPFVPAVSASVQPSKAAAPDTKKRKRVQESSSSSPSVASSSSSSSSSSESDSYTDGGTDRRKSKPRRPSASAAPPRERKPQPAQARTVSLKKPPATERTQEPKEKAKAPIIVAAASASAPSRAADAPKHSITPSSHPSQPQQPPASQPAKSGFHAHAHAASTHIDSARAAPNSFKPQGSQAAPKALDAGSAAVAAAKDGAAVTEADSKDWNQRWQERQAAISRSKLELPPLPSLHPSLPPLPSLPSLPTLPTLPPLPSSKPKPAAAADVKPAAPKVAPPSPVVPYVCGHPFRELSEGEDLDNDLVMGETMEALLGQFLGPLQQRRSDRGEKLFPTTDWRKVTNPLPEWPPKSYAQWKSDCSAARPLLRRDAVDIALLRAELVAISSCSDKPVAQGASDSKEKAKELQEWSAQIDRMDELVHTREELRAYSPPPSRFNDTRHSSRSYIFTASPVSSVPLWARGNDSVWQDEQDVVDTDFIAHALQLLRPWNPAFAIKFAHNQFFVMFQDSAAPSRLRSWVKRDIMSRRAHAHLESCKRIVAARAGDNGCNEGEWFTAAAAAVHKDLPHGVRTVFLNGAAYDLRMQRAVWPDGLFDEFRIADEVYNCVAAAKDDNNSIDAGSVTLLCGSNSQLVIPSHFAAIECWYVLCCNIGRESRTNDDPNWELKEKEMESGKGGGLTEDGRPEVEDLRPKVESLVDHSAQRPSSALQQHQQHHLNHHQQQQHQFNQQQQHQQQQQQQQHQQSMH